jgi:hypothetical protein
MALDVASFYFGSKLSRRGFVLMSQSLSDRRDFIFNGNTMIGFVRLVRVRRPSVILFPLYRFLLWISRLTVLLHKCIK